MADCSGTIGAASGAGGDNNLCRAPHADSLKGEGFVWEYGPKTQMNRGPGGIFYKVQRRGMQLLDAGCLVFVLDVFFYGAGIQIGNLGNLFVGSVFLVEYSAVEGN